MTCMCKDCVTPSSADEAPREYLDKIFSELKRQAPHLSDEEHRQYAYDTGGGWDGYWKSQYPAKRAVAEDMSYWEVE